MSVKARWSNLDVVERDDTDPFAEDAPVEVHIPTVGLPIDIHAPQDTLTERLKQTVLREGALYREGIHCDLKSVPDTTCFACPLYEGDSETAFGGLCRLGREQDTLLTLLAIRKHGDGR